MNNPYSAPVAVLSDPVASDEEYKPNFFAFHGRIGRLRYLLYSFLSSWLLAIVLGILSAIVIPIVARGNAGAGVGFAMIAIIYIPIIAVMLIMAKRRLNDLDHSGWLALLMLVPLVNLLLGLYLLFGRGSEGANNYGLKPSKNPGVIIFVVLGFMSIFVIGILAAIAIPQYAKYVERAKAKAVQTAPQ